MNSFEVCETVIAVFIDKISHIAIGNGIAFQILFTCNCIDQITLRNMEELFRHHQKESTMRNNQRIVTIIACMDDAIECIFYALIDLVLTFAMDILVVFCFPISDQIRHKVADLFTLPVSEIYFLETFGCNQGNVSVFQNDICRIDAPLACGAEGAGQWNGQQTVMCFLCLLDAMFCQGAVTPSLHASKDIEQCLAMADVVECDFHQSRSPPLLAMTFLYQ